MPRPPPRSRWVPPLATSLAIHGLVFLEGCPPGSGSQEPSPLVAAGGSRLAIRLVPPPEQAPAALLTVAEPPPPAIVSAAAPPARGVARGSPRPRPAGTPTPPPDRAPAPSPGAAQPAPTPPVTPAEEPPPADHSDAAAPPDGVTDVDQPGLEATRTWVRGDPDAPEQTPDDATAMSDRDRVVAAETRREAPSALGARAPAVQSAGERAAAGDAVTELERLEPQELAGGVSPTTQQATTGDAPRPAATAQAPAVAARPSVAAVAGVVDPVAVAPLGTLPSVALGATPSAASNPSIARDASSPEPPPDRAHPSPQVVAARQGRVGPSDGAGRADDPVSLPVVAAGQAVGQGGLDPDASGRVDAFRSTAVAGAVPGQTLGVAPLEVTFGDVTALSARATPLGRYLAEVDAVLRARWKVPVELRALGYAGVTVVQVTVDRSGRVRELAITGRSPFPELDAYALAAVPPRLPPLPAEVLGRSAAFQWQFRVGDVPLPP